MSRRTLTRNKRAFKQNDRVFLDENSNRPVDIEIDDGVNPPFTVTVDTRNKEIITDTNAIPGGVVIRGPSEYNVREQ